MPNVSPSVPTRSETSERVLSNWISSHQPLVQNRIIRQFLDDPEHAELLAQLVANPGPANRQRLEESFRRFYFEIRFVSYMTSIVRYRTVDFHRKNRHLRSRMLCIFDQPLNEEGTATVGEYLMAKYAPEKNAKERIHYRPENFQAALDHEGLYRAFAKLSARQKTVATLSFSVQLLEAEIAEILGVSQQSVNQTKKRAILSLRKQVKKSHK